MNTAAVSRRHSFITSYFILYFTNSWSYILYNHNSMRLYNAGTTISKCVMHRIRLTFIICFTMSQSSTSYLWDKHSNTALSTATKDTLYIVTRSSRFVILNLTFAAKGRHSSLWPEAITFERSQWAYLRPEVATVRCGLRSQHLNSYRTGTIWSP